MWIKKIFLQNKDCPKRNTLPPSYKFGHFPSYSTLRREHDKNYKYIYPELQNKN